MNSQKNSREFLVCNGGLATETTLGAFKTSATAGEVGIFPKDGTATAGGAGDSGKDFVVAIKTADSIIVSDVVKPTPTITQNNYSAPVQRRIDISDITVPGVTGATANYLLDIRLYNYGSLSSLNYYLKHGDHFLTQTGSLTAEDVVDALITNLNQNFSKEPGASASVNPYLTFTKGYSTNSITVDTAPDSNGDATVTVDGSDITVALLAADDADGAATKIAAAIDAVSGLSASAATNVVTVTTATGVSAISFAAGTSGATAVTIAGTATTAGIQIEGKEQSIELGKDEGRLIEFDVTFKEASQTATNETVQAGNPGVGSGKQVATLEYFYRGAYGDGFRGMGYPYTWPTSTKTLAEQASLYGLIEVNHAYNGDGINTVKLDKQLSIAVKDSSGSTTNIDAVKAALDFFL